MNWDDLRFALAVADSGSLLAASKKLKVDHTTVGRRIEALEGSLKQRLFTRTTAGYVRTQEADRLLEPLRRVEAAMLEFERHASSAETLEGAVKVTAAETFGASYLAPRLALFTRDHPRVRIELVASGEVLDLGKRQAEIAVRAFRSKQADLVALKVGSVGYGFYASHEYLSRRPITSADDLVDHPVLSSSWPDDVEERWLRKLCPKAKVSFASTLSLSLLAAAKAGAGVAILPRYLGDEEASLKHVVLGESPRDELWLTVHRDLRTTPRVRVLLDFLTQRIRADASRLAGRSR